MKRLYICCLALATIMLASCGGHSPQKLSEKEILKQCKKNLVKLGADSSIVTITTGYYELNDEDKRCQLEKLKAAGVVQYDVERFAWWETTKEKKSIPHTVDYYYTWTGQYAYSKTEYTTKWITNYNFEEHFMVNVSLTENAQKYALDHIPGPKDIDEEDKDLVQPPFYDSLYPENQLYCEENWPEIPHPLADEIFEKCKTILTETESLINEATDNIGFNKAEQKLNSINRIDNLDCMTRAQTSTIDSEKNRLETLIRQGKGNIAYNKCKSIIEEATTLLNNATNCKGLDKVNNKLKSLNYVENSENMSETQKEDINSQTQKVESFVETKEEEFGCNKPVAEDKPKEQPQKKEETPKPDQRDPVAIAYELAKSKEIKNDTPLFAFLKKAIIARNISLTQNDQGTNAVAEIIYEKSKVTDAARVLNKDIDKSRIMGSATFKYYCDKGWILEEATVPNITNKDGSDVNLVETNKKGKQSGEFNGELSGSSISGTFENTIEGSTFNFD